MAYSKLFSGNLPELTCEIIQYFRNDFSTLYSCILVNRLWCRLAIPLLWEDPFSIYVQNFQFIEIYLSNLNEDDKTKFNEYVTINCSSTLFNYPSFIKRLNTHEVVFYIKNWLTALMDYKRWEMFSILVYRSLFKMFIENEGNLHSFEIDVRSTSNDHIYFNDTVELILQNPSFICNIRNLMFYIDMNNNNTSTNFFNIIPLLKFLCSNCNSISSYYIGIFGIFNFEENIHPLVEKWSIQMINTQQNLKKITFGSSIFLYNLFSSLKNPNISNTLKIITFYTIDFKKIITNIQEIFNQLNVLESIHIIYCFSLNSDFVHQIINVIRPFKLKSLIMGQISQVESLQLLIQKFGSDLENLGLGNHNNASIQESQQLFKSIIKYCKKIKYFTLREPDYSNINLLLNLIENIKQNLNYLDIKIDLEESSIIILKNLGQILPSKLEFLKLCLNIKPNELKIFLENSQNTFIKRLFIHNIVQEEDEDILPYIKEYIMKKKRVRYLVIFINYRNLVYLLKDEVEEFKLYNIKLQKYENPYIGYIQAIDIVKNIF